MDDPNGTSLMREIQLTTVLVTISRPAGVAPLKKYHVYGLKLKSDTYEYGLMMTSPKKDDRAECMLFHSDWTLARMTGGSTMKPSNIVNRLEVEDVVMIRSGYKNLSTSRAKLKSTCYNDIKEFQRRLTAREMWSWMTSSTTGDEPFGACGFQFRNMFCNKPLVERPSPRSELSLREIKRLQKTVTNTDIRRWTFPPRVPRSSRPKSGREAVQVMMRVPAVATN